jgi:hypothetical protein
MPRLLHPLVWSTLWCVGGAAVEKPTIVIDVRTCLFILPARVAFEPSQWLWGHGQILGVQLGKQNCREAPSNYLDDVLGADHLEESAHQVVRR